MWTVRGLVTYYTIFAIELQSRRVHVVGSTRHPDEAFVVQAMRHMTDGFDGVLGRGRVLICDRDRKWSRAVREFLEQEHVRIIQTPFRAPNCNERNHQGISNELIQPSSEPVAAGLFAAERIWAV